MCIRFFSSIQFRKKRGILFNLVKKGNSRQFVFSMSSSPKCELTLVPRPIITKGTLVFLIDANLSHQPPSSPNLLKIILLPQCQLFPLSRGFFSAKMPSCKDEKSFEKRPRDKVLWPRPLFPHFVSFFRSLFVLVCSCHQGSRLMQRGKVDTTFIFF